jgi:LacI family transcriptional regulator
VTHAIQFIREHACDSIQVEDVLRVVPLSRKVLEMRFKSLLNHTLHDEIVRVRIARAKQLLTDTDFTLADIAARTGFQHPEYFSVAFKRETNSTPGRYRLDQGSSPNTLKIRSLQAR